MKKLICCLLLCSGAFASNDMLGECDFWLSELNKSYRIINLSLLDRDFDLIINFQYPSFKYASREAIANCSDYPKTVELIVKAREQVAETIELIK